MTGADRLREDRERLYTEAAQGDRGLDRLPRILSDAVDGYFRRGLTESSVGVRTPFSLVAVGGYGRSELCPGSDIDILILFSRRISARAEQLVQELFYPLWDLRFDLGHGVRTVADCVSLSLKDQQVMTSLMDARLVGGDSDVFHALRERFHRRVLTRRERTFADWLVELNHEREDKAGDASALLEPELKNGLGGLRDVHQIRWLAEFHRAAGRELPFTSQEMDMLAADEALVLRTRTALHLAAGRKLDRLVFDMQPVVAEYLGHDRNGLGVESFLSDLHRSMERIKAMRAAFMREAYAASSRARRGRADPAPGVVFVPSGLAFDPPDTVPDPEAVWAMLLFSAHTGEGVSWPARRQLVAGGHDLGRAMARTEQAMERLLETVRAPHGAAALETMMETGVLGGLLPSFAEVQHLVQFDDYHLHPVGRHTLRTVRGLAGFLQGQGPDWAVTIARSLQDPDVLLMAALYHDLGKGSGRDHSELGAELARRELEEFGVEPQCAERAAHLVLHHLLIPRTATRSDLNDPATAEGVARLAGSVTGLDALYLLSVADSMATGPRAWSEWTKALFRELYFKARRVLNIGPVEDDRDRRLVAARDRVRSHPGAGSLSGLEAALDHMPAEALLSQDASAVLLQVELVRRLREKMAQERVRKPSAVAGVGVCVVHGEASGVPGVFRVSVAACERTGLFATVAGVMSLHRLDIHAARAFTWSDGTVVDVFTVSGVNDSLYPEEVWERIRRGVQYALLGKLQLDSRLEERRNSPLASIRSGPPLPPRVSVSDGGSGLSVVEVAAPDRPGLLHDMARVLNRLGLTIVLAKVTTDEGRAADVFHVRGAEGELCRHEADRVEEAMLAELSQDE